MRGIMEAFNQLYPFDYDTVWVSSSMCTEEEYQEWITNNLEQYYKEITNGEIEETRK